jgi:hypothetical protein
MEIRPRDYDAKLHSRLHVSSLDLNFAQYCVGVILKKGWHCQPWEKRGSIYQQQSAFMSALVIAYARPFTKSRDWPKFPSELKKFDSEENTLHDHMIELRNSVYAHSDSKNYSVTPWRSGNFSTDIVGGPALRVGAEQAALLRQMINKLQLAIQRRMSQIVQVGGLISPDARAVPKVRSPRV